MLRLTNYCQKKKKKMWKLFKKLNLNLKNSNIY